MRLHKARQEGEALRQVRGRMEQTPGKILILEEECTWFDAVLRLNEKRTEPILFLSIFARTRLGAVKPSALSSSLLSL
jgi:uncharacterized UPF0160 family protein